MQVTIPENISDITLEQFQKFTKLIERDDLNEIELQKRLISIFTNIKYNDTDKISKIDFDDLVNSINKAMGIETPFNNTFKLNGVDYGFIPNLDNITAKEWMDLQLYPLNKTETLHKLMAILFRPITKKDSFSNYKIESYNGTEDRAELFKYMPMNVVNGAIGFFLTLQKQLLNHIQKSMIQEQQREAKQMSTFLSGDGMQP